MLICVVAMKRVSGLVKEDFIEKEGFQLHLKESAGLRQTEEKCERIPGRQYGPGGRIRSDVGYIRV